MLSFDVGVNEKVIHRHTNTPSAADVNQPMRASESRRAVFISTVWEQSHLEHFEWPPQYRVHTIRHRGTVWMTAGRELLRLDTTHAMNNLKSHWQMVIRSAEKMLNNGSNDHRFPSLSPWQLKLNHRRRMNLIATASSLNGKRRCTGILAPAGFFSLTVSSLLHQQIELFQKPIS